MVLLFLRAFVHVEERNISVIHDGQHRLASVQCNIMLVLLQLI